MYLPRQMPLIKRMNKKQMSLNRILYPVMMALMTMLVWLPGKAQVKEHYLQAVALTERQAYPEARDHLDEALGHDPDNPDCLLKMAEVCHLSGDTRAALDYLERLEAAEPGMGSYLSASIYASFGNAAETVRHLERHLRSPYKLPYHSILLDDAFTPVEMSPEWKALWKGTWYTGEEELLQEIRYLAGSGEYLQALERIDSGLGEIPDQGDLYEARGDVLFEMGQFQASVQAYTLAMETGSTPVSRLYGRARAYIAQKKYDRAIADMEKAYRMEPEKLEMLMEIGKVYHRAGQPGKADNYLARYLDYFPDDAGARFLSGQICYESGKHLDALAQFNACLRLDKGDPRFFAARGKTYLATKTYRYALNDFGMALDLDPDDHETWYMKGLVRWNMNEREGAIRDWEQAARLGSFEAARKLEEHGRR